MSPARTPMTPRRLQILTFMRAYLAEHGCAPTMREISEHVGLNKVTVHEHLKCLVRDRHVEQTRHVARGYVPVMAERTIVVDGAGERVAASLCTGHPQAARIDPRGRYRLILERIA